MIQKIYDVVVRIMDAVPFLKGYKTAIVLSTLGIVAGLDATGITHGLYAQLAPVLWPVATVSALAHDNTNG